MISYCFYTIAHIAEFRLYFEHTRSLKFDDRPDYDYLKRLFRELFFRKGFTYDNMFDWEVLALPKEQRPNQSTMDGNGHAATHGESNLNQTTNALAPSDGSGADGDFRDIPSPSKERKTAPAGGSGAHHSHAKQNNSVITGASGTMASQSASAMHRSTKY